MNKKNTLTPWVLIHNETGSFDSVNKEVLSHAPLNRVLNEASFYDLQFFEVNSDLYFNF